MQVENNALFTEVDAHQRCDRIFGGATPTVVAFDWNTLFFYTGVAAFFNY
ncbi:MAG: hypothetical protein ACHBN1_32030 [Heteroscytonema crispum UTEX LB 1556]